MAESDEEHAGPALVQPQTNAETQTLLRVKRLRDEPSQPTLTVFNDGPSAKRVSMAQLRLQKDGVGPMVRQYRLLAANVPDDSSKATRPKQRAPIKSSSKGPFTALGRNRAAHEQRATSFRYKCVQERRMAPIDALAHIGGDGKRALDARRVRMLDLELSSEQTAAVAPSRAPITPFGPPVPPTQPADAAGASDASSADALPCDADAYVYDVYVADDTPSALSAAQPAVYIEYADDGNDDEFASDDEGSDFSTDDSNAEGHYANDYPDSEHSDDSIVGNTRFDDEEDDVDTDDSDAAKGDGQIAGLLRAQARHRARMAESEPERMAEAPVPGVPEGDETDDDV
jgi:hypothetical protein